MWILCFFLSLSSPHYVVAISFRFVHYLLPFAFSFRSLWGDSSRFEKNDILRVVRALAIFRPSLIALQMPLSLDDEIFVEKCFQRSLLVCYLSLTGR